MKPQILRDLRFLFSSPCVASARVMGIKGLGLKDKTCWFCGDFSALSRGKVTILVGRACLVPVAYPQPTRFVLSHLYSVISHVIPLRLLQTLNLHRWNCNVFGWSRKMTVGNYVRNLCGVVSMSRLEARLAPAAAHRHRGLAFRCCRRASHLRCLECCCVG